MATKQAKELRNLSPEKLREKEVELRKELIKLNAQVATGVNPQNPGRIKVLKKGIARIKTIVHEKELKKEK